MPIKARLCTHTLEQSCLEAQSPSVPKGVSPPELCVGIPTLSKGKMQSKCWLTGQATCSSLFSALPPIVDLSLSHLLRATSPPPSPRPPMDPQLVSSQVIPASPMFKSAISLSGITKKPAILLGPVTVPSGRQLNQGQEEMALSLKASL